MGIYICTNEISHLDKLKGYSNTNERQRIHSAVKMLSINGLLPSMPQIRSFLWPISVFGPPSSNSETEACRQELTMQRSTDKYKKRENKFRKVTHFHLLLTLPCCFFCTRFRMCRIENVFREPSYPMAPLFTENRRGGPFCCRPRAPRTHLNTPDSPFSGVSTASNHCATTTE